MAVTPFFFQEGLARVGPGFFQMAPLLLCLDFDGTLSAIAPTPGAAWMGEGVRNLLWRFSRRAGTRLAILSGRSVPDLKKKVGLPGIIYVGNHGLNFSPSSLGWGTKALANWTRQARLAQDRLEPLAAQWPGSLLEIKGPDLSLHYRRVRPKQVRKLVFRAIQAVEGIPVVPRQGKCVLEFRPKGAPGKAEALDRLAQRFFKDEYSGACLHIGDDQTDEEVFEALRNMGRRTLGLKVGVGKTKAPFRLKDTRQVYRFLRLFMEDSKVSKS
jgi:trehalose-phosphatase